MNSRRRAAAITARSEAATVLAPQACAPGPAGEEPPPGGINRSTLVLFGTRETNKLIARFADRFPLALNSGLPFWTGTASATRLSLQKPEAMYQVLDSFPDYILFVGPLANMVAEGRFRRGWMAPAEEAIRARATGVVDIK